MINRFFLFIIKHIFIIFIVSFFYLGTINDDLGYKIQEFFFLISLIDIGYYLYYKNNSILNINIIFISLFVFFLGIRPIIDLFGIKNILSFDFFINTNISPLIMNRVILNLNIAINSYMIGLYLYKIFNRYNDNYIIKQSNLNISSKLCWYLIIIGGSFKLYMAIEMFTAIINQGYLSYFTGDLDVKRHSIIFGIVSGFIDVGIFLMIFSKRKIDLKLLLVSFIYMIMSFSTGQRGPGMLFFYFIFFIYMYTKRLHVKLTKIIPIIVFFSLLLSFISWLRSDNSSPYEFSIFDFFWGQGVSITVLTESIRWDHIIDYKFTDLFGYITYAFDYYKYKFTGIQFPFEVPEIGEIYKFYSGYISNISNPNLKDLGFGLGGSYIAEMYSVGKECAQFLGGIFFSIIINFFFAVLKNSKGFWKFYAFHILPFLLYIPRDNCFDFVLQDWYILISYIIVDTFNRIKYRKHSKDSV